MSQVGGFPFEQKIKSIARIEVYSDERDQDAVVIFGSRIRYNSSDRTAYRINRGLVNKDKVDSMCE